jgi:hypothetical protein
MQLRRGGLFARRPVVEPSRQHRSGKADILRAVFPWLHEPIYYTGHALVFSRDG